MKRYLSLLASTALVAFGATVASAADLPSRAAPMAPVFAAPVFNWSGFYAGLNAGYGFGTNDDAAVFVPGLGLVANGGGDDGGFVGGGQIGFNWQVGQLVYGIEADLQYADLGNTRNNDVFVGGAPVFFGAGSAANIDWFGTVRARLGFAIDRVLIYATGGLAYADISGGNGFTAVNGVVVAVNGNDDIQWGWTIGGGVEFALPTNWNMLGSSAVTFRIEGLYVNIEGGDRAGGVFVGPGGPVAVAGNGSSNAEFGVVRAGLNFKF
jgi:outer membrane immunogenic protein